MMRSFIGRLDGPSTRGRGRVFWLTATVAFMIAGGCPLALDSYTIGNISLFLVWVPMALGLCLLWGYGGILGFGQTAFFGLAAYAYSVASINLGNGWLATCGAAFLALAVAVIAAAILGYFMFYGGVGDVFVGIVTLSTTLVLETFLAQTAGPVWHIGAARLGGFNGINAMPPISLPWFGDDLVLDGQPLYAVLLGGCAVTYLALRSFVNSASGQVLVAARDNPGRTEMLGYDVAGYRTAAFTIAGGLAGLSGVAYVAWGQYITPDSMGLNAAALPVVWVTVGGRRDLTATLVGTLAVLELSQFLAVHGNEYALVALGGLLLAAVLFAPDGIVVAIADLAPRLVPKRVRLALFSPRRGAARQGHMT